MFTGRFFMANSQCDVDYDQYKYRLGFGFVA